MSALRPHNPHDDADDPVDAALARLVTTLARQAAREAFSAPAADNSARPGVATGQAATEPQLETKSAER